MSKLPSQCLPTPEAYFDCHRGCYWIQNLRGGWIQINETSLKRLLRGSGFVSKPIEAGLISEVDEILIRIQRGKDVSFAGPLAGFQIGVHQVMESRILVTTSPRLVEAKPGEWPILEKLLEGLLYDPIQDQRIYLFGWLKVAIESLRAGQRRPGQALVMAGEHNSGKSLLQNLITILLGGRMAKPYQFMTGLTSFNSDLFEGEHLMIEDEAASTDIRARRNFGANLKNITVNEVQRHHAKNRVALSLPPFWRLSVTVNDEPENLMVLPPIDDSIEDKIILLKAHKMPMPMPTNTLEERKTFWTTMVSELPAFVSSLLNWQIPNELRCQRFGISHFHHPELLSAIDDLAPERRLLSLIDGELFSMPGTSSWEGTADQLERRLIGEESGSAYEARRVLSFNTACGVYLARLAKKYSTRVQKHRGNQSRQWIIHPPQ